MSEWTGTRLAPNGGAPPPGNPFAPARTSTPSDPSLDAVVSRARELLKDAGTAPTYLAIKRELERVLDASAHPAAGGLSGGAGEFGTEAATAGKSSCSSGLLSSTSSPHVLRCGAQVKSVHPTRERWKARRREGEGGRGESRSAGLIHSRINIGTSRAPALPLRLAGEGRVRHALNSLSLSCFKRVKLLKRLEATCK